MPHFYFLNMFYVNIVKLVVTPHLWTIFNNIHSAVYCKELLQACLGFSILQLSALLYYCSD